MKITNIKREVALLMSCLYLFVALFSQSFHKHSEISLGITVKEVFSKNQDAKIGLDKTSCLSCHFLLVNFSEAAPEFHFDFIANAYFESELTAYQNRFAGLVPSVFHLRGPPEFVI